MDRILRALDLARVRKLAGSALWPLVSLRRYLARNHPFLWQIRLHLLLFLFVVLAALCLSLGYLLPISPYSVPNIEGWHLVLFFFSMLGVLYWLVSYLLLLDPGQMPPTISEPTLVVLVACSIFILLPSYGFLSLATHRMVRAFPDLAHEERAREVLRILAVNAGDRGGVFKTFNDDAMEAKRKSGDSAFAPADPNAVAGNDPHSEYFAGADGVIGPADKKGMRAQQFKVDLVCQIGNAALHHFVRIGKFRTQGAAATGETGRLIPAGPGADSAQRVDSLSQLFSAYKDLFQYEVRGNSLNVGQKYLLSFGGALEEQSIVARLKCASFDVQTVDRLFDAISQASKALFRDYLPPMRENELAKLSNAVLTPVCEVGQRVEDCKSTDKDLAGLIALLDQFRTSQKLDIIKMAVGRDEVVDDYEVVLSNVEGDPSARVLTVSPKRTTTKLGGALGMSEAWLLGWLFILALLATGAKSFRLIRAPANYVFAALFFVPAVILVATFGSLWINEKLALLYSYLGWKHPSFSLDGDSVLLGYFVLALVYVLWQVTRRRCSQAARVIASFNLFFLLVMSAYLPFMTFPVVGNIPGNSWVMPIVYVVYFGLIYDVCYTIARRARARPA